MRDYENLIQQEAAEKHILSVCTFNKKFLEVLRTEDFIFFQSDFELVRLCMSDDYELLKRKREFYRLQENSVFLANLDETVIYFLHENTFFRLAIKLLNDLSSKTIEHEKKALYQEVLQKCYSIDVFDLIDFLPSYFDSIGQDSKRFYAWKGYCLNRVEKLKINIGELN